MVYFVASFIFLICLIIIVVTIYENSSINSRANNTKKYDKYSCSEDFINYPKYSSLAGNIYNEAYKNSHPDLFGANGGISSYLSNHN